MNYSRRDFLSDVIFISVIALIGFGGIYLVKGPLMRVWDARAERQSRERTPVREGTQVDEDWSVQTLDGKDIPYSSLKGKIIFLNFWATWCGPCLIELPSIEKLYERYKDTDMVFMCVSGEDAQTIKDFVSEADIKVPVYTIRDIPKSFHANGLPVTFIISQSGKIALSRLGANRWDKESVIQLIEGLGPKNTGATRPKKLATSSP